MNKTTENLWKALEQYTPPETKPLVWKLVYDPDSGKPLDVTTEDINGTYIEISRREAETYPHQDPRVSVVDGKLSRRVKRIKSHEIPYKLQVFPDDKGNIATDPYNMLLINNNNENNRWKYD